MTLLDTHAWIWWTSDPGRLSRKARHAIESAPRLGVAAISCWEVATLVERQRIAIDRGTLEWMEQSLAASAIELLPLTPAIAVRSTQLGRVTLGDPADRLILATASVHEALLVTKDERIRACPLVRTVW